MLDCMLLTVLLYCTVTTRYDDKAIKCLERYKDYDNTWALVPIIFCFFIIFLVGSCISCIACLERCCCDRDRKEGFDLENGLTGYLRRQKRVFGKISTKGKETETCAVCLTNFTYKSIVTELHCAESHIFHDECIKDWFESQKVKNDPTFTCPMCRQPVNFGQVKGAIPDGSLEESSDNHA